MMALSGYFGLFFAAMGAATLLPMQSEAVLVGLLLTGQYATWALLVVAITGNVFGSVLNWLLGRSIEHYRHKRWFPVSEARLEKAQRAYQRYGRWSLLLSWVPIIGDPITMIAGVLREPFWSFVLIVTLAKASRYLLLAALTLGWLGVGYSISV
ncbi:DedA family protein [Pseudomonas sp. 21TX0197]|uniref:YqaA family protein n=1 Tax=Pseudomonas TaxID=286 RepID=UPI000B81904F|nr:MULTISPECIES: YqaA family protein [Pseudomonas]MDB6442568.1 DedA family protein [Pseudomonas sp. 21TX0197]MDT8909147.1 YqaA family protein [Pseudomonas prosekii]NHN68247.1 DedA family protein [Pseudomonas fluorescens]